MKKYMVSDKSAGYGGRVTKYKHRFCNTEFGSLKFTKQELGIICVMLLRGPQTPGELRSRTNRLCEFADAEEVEATLRDPDGARGRAFHRTAAASAGRARIPLRASVLGRAGIAPRARAARRAQRRAGAPTLSERVSALEEQVPSCAPRSTR